MTGNAKIMTMTANSMASEIAHELVEFAGTLGVERAAHLSAASLDSAAFEDPSARISFAQAILLWSHLARHRPGLPVGVMLGRRSVSGFGPLALAAQNTSCGSEALQLLETYFASMTTGGRLVSERDGTFVRISIQHLPEVESLGHPIDFGITLLCRLLVGDDFRGKVAAVQCRHGPFGSASYYEEIFGTKFNFGATSNTLWICRELLDDRRLNCNPRMVHYLQSYLLEQVARLPRPPLPFSVHLTQTVQELAREGCFQSNAVAVRMGLSPRSLQRRAAAGGLHVSIVIETARQEQAILALRNSTASLATIAELLGYSDERSFSRAFQRWTGLTPSTWRKKQDT